VVRDIGLLTQSSGQQPPAEPGPSEAILLPWWSRLGRLMQQHEAEARDVMDDMLGQLPGIRRWSEALALREALQRYDFDEAAQRFEQWQQAVREGEGA